MTRHSNNLHILEEGPAAPLSPYWVCLNVCPFKCHWQTNLFSQMRRLQIKLRAVPRKRLGTSNHKTSLSMHSINASTSYTKATRFPPPPSSGLISTHSRLSCIFARSSEGRFFERLAPNYDVGQQTFNYSYWCIEIATRDRKCSWTRLRESWKRTC